MSYMKRIRRTRAMQQVGSNKPKRCSSHVQPRPPVIDLNGPGRLRTAHVLALCGISHSTLYARIKTGVFPKPDGADGKLKYWNTQTIRALLAS